MLEQHVRVEKESVCEKEREERRSERKYYRLHCIPPQSNSYVEALICQNMTFGDRVFKEVIKLK